ncbi:type III secretion protein HrpB7 [Burkholderia oklahomensis]|nr:type III secretion protein HrpB7 [Burkholderia oklahomensis]AJX36027.1 type III secretion protein HrpB7 [Burkholderia oklahomensis C6786]SUY26591.1 type III secretion protein HrpB7 [Burkholderia oklahomensis]
MMAGVVTSPARSRRAVAFARVRERRRKLDAVLREELAAGRAALRPLEKALAVKVRQVELKTADVRRHADRIDALTSGSESFSLDELLACRAYLDVAGTRLRALEMEEAQARAALDDAVAAVEQKSREIARNLGRIDACSEHIERARRDCERMADEALDEEVEEAALARRMRNRGGT